MGSSEVKLGNPAVVGLAGFSMTTFVLQCHNLGLCGIAPVLWLGIFFGGGAQLIAGLFEFKKNNNFGFCAFTSYGAFWISLCCLIIFGQSPELAKSYPVFAFNATDLGYFLTGWTILTFGLFIASMKHNTTLALVFLTLLLGFIGLVIKEFTGSSAAGLFAAYDLILCAFLAFYLMLASIFGEAGIKLPIGGPWF